MNGDRLRMIHPHYISIQLRYDVRVIAHPGHFVHPERRRGMQRSWLHLTTQAMSGGAKALVPKWNQPYSHKERDVL